MTTPAPARLAAADVQAAPARPAPGGAARGILLAGAGVAVAVCVAQGDLALFAGLLLAMVVPWAVVKAPGSWTSIGLLVVVLVVDDPAGVPHAKMWDGPLLPIGSLLYSNLHAWTGIDALRFSLLDVAVVALVGLALWRRGDARRVAVQDPAPLTFSLWVAGAGLAVLWAWGLARGGDFRNSLWQVRQLLFLPLVAALFQLTLRGPKDHKLLGAVLVGAALFKAGLGLYFYEVIARPLNVRPPVATTHADSMLFALGLVAVLAAWHERPGRRTWLVLLTAGPMLLLAMKINNRRLAYVEVAAFLACAWPLVPWTPLKRLAARVTLVGAPLVALYLAAGWNSSAGLFRPAQMVRSLADSSSDRSTATRDIENFNLTRTFRENPLVGLGFGHPYREVVRADDISQFFALYRFIPHNSVLELWAFGGLLGFTAIWLPMLTSLFLALRAYPRARDPVDRAAALTFAAMTIIYTLQAWGDMGMQSWEGVFLQGACVALSGKLAVAVGAWPERRRRRPVPAALSGPGRALRAGAPASRR